MEDFKCETERERIAFAEGIKAALNIVSRYAKETKDFHGAGHWYRGAWECENLLENKLYIAEKEARK